MEILVTVPVYHTRDIIHHKMIIFLFTVVVTPKLI